MSLPPLALCAAASIKRLRLLALTALFMASPVFAGSATWQLDPFNVFWNVSGNWNPATLPNAAADVATFDASNIPSVLLNKTTQVNGIVFNAAASGFTISAAPGLTLTISGTGITNNSGITQNFVA